MKIWLLTIGEPVPHGVGVVDRLHRTGSFARYLVSRGHEVVWWTSAFDHFHKQHVVGEDTFLMEPDGLRIRLLRGCGYQRNVSLARFRDHRQVAQRFRELCELEEKPDIVVTALPTLDMCIAAGEYGRRHSVPTVIDLRDMWPDIFAEVVPELLRPLAQVALIPLYLRARHICAQATAVTGITEAFVDWGLKRGRRTRSEIDRAFPFTYNTDRPGDEALRVAESFWDGHGVEARPLNGGQNEGKQQELVVCYFGNMSLQLDLSHVIEAARQLETRGVRVKLVLCGEGQRIEEYRHSAKGMPSIVFPGWVNRASIYSLMRRSSVGLDPLPDRMNFVVNINNKAIEYLSAGLPVVASPERGVLYDLLKGSGAGVSYAADDASSLANCLEVLAMNQGRLKPMCENAEALFAREFCAGVVYPAMEAHLMAVCDSYARSEVAVASPETATGIAA
jgi:glycosyltransferase involved in cell wall biosynthesis